MVHLSRTQKIVIGVLISLALFFVLVPATDESDSLQAVPDTYAAEEDTNYLLLIDAGSSGSRLHVFTYYKDHEHALPTILPSEQLKQKPGLSSFEDNNPEEAGQALIELLEFAKDRIPAARWATTPLLLQATAGLRMVEPDQTEMILESCRNVLEASPFYFQRQDAKVISGLEEGVFGWMAINYLRKAFDPAEDVAEQIHTVGVVEMGGASMQLTYKPHAQKILPVLMDGTDDPLEIVLMTINGQHFTLYSHSYLNYGLQEAQKLFQVTNIDEIEEKGNPCYPDQFKHSSTGNYKQCTELVSNIFQFSNESCAYDDHQCGFNNVYQPLITDEQFLAIENFFYTTSFYGVNDQANFVDHLQESGESFCEQSWLDLVQKYPEESGYDLSKYCFASAYIPTVLQHAFGFTKTQLHDNLEVARQIEGTDIDWAIGSALTSIVGATMTDTALKPLSSAFKHRTSVLDNNNLRSKSGLDPDSNASIWLFLFMAAFMAVFLYFMHPPFFMWVNNTLFASGAPVKTSSILPSMNTPHGFKPSNIV